MNSQQIPITNEQQANVYASYVQAAQQQHQLHLQQQAARFGNNGQGPSLNGIAGIQGQIGVAGTTAQNQQARTGQPNSHLIGLNTQQLRSQLNGANASGQNHFLNGAGLAMAHNLQPTNGQGQPVQVTHLHHAQGIAAGHGQLASNGIHGQGALGSVGAQIIGISGVSGNSPPLNMGNIIQGSNQGQTVINSNSAQAYNALMNQIGGLTGLTYQAAQAQAHAQAQAIVNAQQAQLALQAQNGARVLVNHNQVNAAAVHHLAQAQRVHAQMGNMGHISHQIGGQIGSIPQLAQLGTIQQPLSSTQAAANLAQYQYNRQIQQMQQYGSEAEDSDELDSDNEIHNKNLKNGQYTSEEDEFEFPKLIPIRASTAPPRPLTEIEEFRRSSDFLLLENTVMMSDHLKQRPDEKYDLDSEDGQRACKRFLNQIERLCERFKAMCATRKYREQFSKAYKVLYKEGSLCYLTEILDSAQEGFPYLWVNGEKYVFSQDVLEAGRKLFQQFKMIQQIIRNIYERIMEEVNITVQDVLEDMGKNLQEFDHTWVAYEQIYVLELMLIEADARRFITEAIETEKELTNIELREKSRGRIVVDHPEYNQKRSKVIQILGKINSVANPEGMGRDDLSNDILMAAEGIFRRVSPHQSKAVRVLAERIKKTFLDFRNLLKKYEQNIEVVDPQLKNNVELVEILVEFENTWTQGLTYFMDHKKCHQLIHFSSVIEATGEKHKAFSEQLETREAEIFFTIPSLLILKSLEGDDKEICSFFNPDMFDKNTAQGSQLVKLKENYEEGRQKMGSSFDYYNLIEKCLLEVSLSEKEKKDNVEYDVQNKIIKEIKGLAMGLSRFKPADWNKFLDVVIK